MTRTSIVSRWATDDTLVKKAVEEDLKHNHIPKTTLPFKKMDPIAKKANDKKKEEVLEDNSGDYEYNSEYDGNDNEEDDGRELEDEEIIPIPKSQLSKEAQRLFPVENFKDNKENNKSKTKHIIPTGPKSVRSKCTEKHPNKHVDIDLNIISPPPSREKDGKKETHVKKIIYTDDLLLKDQKKATKKKTNLSSKWESKTTVNKPLISPPSSSGTEKETIEKQRVTEKNNSRKIRELERERIRKAKSGKGLEWDDGKQGASEREKHFKVHLRDKYEEERNRNKNRNKNANANAHGHPHPHPHPHANANASINVNAVRNGKNNHSPHKTVREPHKNFAFDDVNHAHREKEDGYDDDDEIEVDNAAIEAVMAKLKDASIDWTADDNDYF